MKDNFDFGENWKNYLKTINQDMINSSILDLIEIFGEDTLKDKTFCDIGCGSGIHSLSALLLGAKHVSSFDINEKNIENTKNLIQLYWKNKNYSIERKNILKNYNNNQYDIVYSWGVLHHTGDMNLAILNTLKHCKKNSILLLALYEKTIYCNIWKKIKKKYNSSGNFGKKFILYSYNFLKILGLVFSLKNPYLYIKNYKSNRGMSFMYDQIDWIGGYPYESIEKNELINIVGSDYKLEIYKPAKKGTLRSIFGTGCSIYKFKRL
jgi:2-polyprenyl-6-hydroxyphenyl methylase/3-demethylubiquinone-9 3-methyltransferase